MSLPSHRRELVPELMQRFGCCERNAVRFVRKEQKQDVGVDTSGPSARVQLLSGDVQRHATHWQIRLAARIQ